MTNIVANIVDLDHRRERHTVDERHNIRPPTGSVADAAVWGNSILKTRVNDLFLTEGGLANHVNAIQQELNRIPSIDTKEGKNLDKDVAARLQTEWNRIKGGGTESCEGCRFSATWQFTPPLPFK